MKTLCFLTGKTSLLFCFYFFYGCNSKNDNAVILLQIDEGLLQSNRQIKKSSDNILEALQNSVYNARTRTKAMAIQPKALAVHDYTNKMLLYIDGIKTTLKNTDKQKRFKKENEISELYLRLMSYKNSVLATDPRLAANMSDSITLVDKKWDKTEEGKQLLRQALVKSPVNEAMAYLSRLQNNLLINENKLLLFLFREIADRSHHDEFFCAIVGQNAQILEAGRTLEIIAGMGSFTKYPIAQTTVDGRLIPLNEKGVAVHQIKTSEKPGNYAVPVQIKFTDQDGNGQMRTITVGYKTLSSRLK